MNTGPGKWSDWLFDGASRSRHPTFTDYGEETTAAVLMAAQDWVSRYTVLIGPGGMAEDIRNGRAIAPASGVLVQLGGDVYGIMTAAHVLRPGGNTENAASATVLAPPRPSGQDGGFRRLTPRRCTVDGFDNETEKGPDIAIVPLLKEEWETLDGWGMVAYNLDRVRWPDEEKAEFRKMNPWAVSVILGARSEASRIIQSHRNGAGVSSQAIMATNTRVDDAEDRGEYDYLELPSEITELSRPTHWRPGAPGTAAQEIEDLHGEGVTRKVWGGTSGAGVWNLVVGTAGDGLPNGRVRAELAGICFYADKETGCVVAHGAKSIRTIATRHLARLGSLAS